MLLFTAEQASSLMNLLKLYNDVVGRRGSVLSD